MSGLTAPVFIVGGSRTGSEMLKTMLSASPELNFTEELFILCPRWLHKDLRANIVTHVGDLASPGALDLLLDLLFSGIPFGWTWSHASKELDRSLLRKELARRPLTIESILTAIILVNAQIRNKPRPGAKFPVHYSYAKVLLRWYPDCKIIHTTRDPRAVYASQANKYIKAEDSWVRMAFEKSRQFAHVNIQVAWTAKIHRQLCTLPNYRLVRYEDVLGSHELVVRDICRFLEIDYLPSMLNPNQYGSSFGSAKGRRGIDQTPMHAWRARISPTTAKAMRILQARAAQTLGYHLSDD